MSISVADRPIQKPGDISEIARLAIAFIDGGTEWLRWAIGEPTARYAFTDESALAAGIQQGLHASRFAFAPRLGLMVSPVKLMTLNLTDLRVLARAESGGAGAKMDAQASPILHLHGLLTQTDFQSGEAYLTELGVADAPQFQFVDFEAQAAVYELASRAARAADPNLALEKEAAAFGVAQGHTPQAFADYFRVYLAMAEKSGGSTSQTKREATAEAAVNALAPLIFANLDCPQVAGLVPPDEVAEALRGWLAQGRATGFPRLSSGVRQIAENTRYKPELGQDANDFVEGYMRAAQALLRSAPLKQGVMAQDGATCAFSLDRGDEQAEIQLGPTGVISLGWLRRKPKATAATASPVAAAKAKGEAPVETTP